MSMPLWLQPSLQKAECHYSGYFEAWRMVPTKDSPAEFSYGAGHIDPVKVVDPCLVYETFTEDYVDMLCNLGYDNATLRKILGVNFTCPTGVRKALQCGPRNSTYKATTSKSPDYNISVRALNERKSSEVIISGKINGRKMVSAE
ncbi:UNVERIFIED_CONTAM: Subtilisin-like protease SBT1.1 [Sesamum latifolium]|uniref:Subtilisin-like protease SBT1.1 n=1 Tax=Sesamum latifolium TaxID=2727402 RepID=A0AAW2Y2M1_9LAMI